MTIIHPTADVAKNTIIGENTQIWHQAQIREGTKIGAHCIIAKGVYIDENTIIGNNVKIQNYASLYHTVIIEDGVFIGPYVCITNDRFPRAISPDGTIKSENDWTSGTTIIRKGASLGAGTIVVPNIEIGAFAMIGSGSLVTKNIPTQALVYGHPATIQGYVCICGVKLTNSA
jgi:UDP-2-acetamido-3-amino-2,3-dideoxy-glucuronate N-acetyltransferase